MHAAVTLCALTLVAVGVMLTCGLAARRTMFLLCAFVGVPLGLALDLNDFACGQLLWLLSGAAAAVCASLTDQLELRVAEGRGVRGGRR
jgi:hypothetical protein